MPLTTAIPTLTTARLSLCLMTMTDWPAYAAFMASDPARHMGGPFSKTAAWGMFCADHAQWDLFGCGALTIRDGRNGDCIGQVGTRQ
ncbi:GNAT family N-acetyltransferase [Paracoccus pacificus]|uniref:GNAT family N-acetyltransferase n=1 Tax=Paracoccus pacificus TaxID=1463598 RepID=A0ABW4RBW2_9RHOB